MMEIEKLKDNLNNAAGGPVGVQMCHEAADAIEQLQTKNEELSAKLDAAIKQLHGYCPFCTHYTPNHNEGPCRTCKHEYYHLLNNESLDNWEWRGPQKED